jgi:MT0933-like antitoxin protein
VDKGVEKAGDLADEKTGGRFSDQVQQGEQRAEDFLGQGDQGGQNQ